MAREVAQRHQERLAQIKERIRDSYEYFRENYERYNKFRKFVFESSLSDEEITLLQSLNRPTIEFNIVEAYVSRLRGEFSKQEPDIEVSATDSSKSDPMMIALIEQHMKHVLGDDDNSHLRYNVYGDGLTGGFSTAKVVTEYEHPMSMNQVIRFKRTEPTMTGFDKLARESHKGDGRFCFEIFAKSEDEFEEEYPDLDMKTLSFSKNFEGFSWSFKSGNEKTVLVVDYYERVRKEESIVLLSDNTTMMMKDYRALLEDWDDIEVPPVPVGKPRKTLIDRIDRYRIVESKVIEYEETDFEMMPIVFIDGNSIMLADVNNANLRQMTRPYVYHAEGAQRLKNFAGISLANEIENSIQSKFLIAKEALPKEEELLNAYLQNQKESLLVYNSVYENNPELPIMNPVREVQRMPAPPEITQAFVGTDSLMQNVLGSYDASLGINNNQLSGIAIVEAASQSNATAMPYIVSCLQGFQRLAQIYIHLMPKYFTTPRTLPMIDDKGKRQYVMINGEEGVPMDFDHYGLGVSVKAGASFQVQKSRTLQQVTQIMQMSQPFSQFIADKGLMFILDQLEGHGIEQLKDLTEEWQEESKQQQQQMQQAEQQEKQAMMQQAQQAQQLEQQKADNKHDIDGAKLELEAAKLEINTELTQESLEIQLLKALMDKDHKSAQQRLSHIDVNERHHHNRDKLSHDFLKTKRMNPNV